MKKFSLALTILTAVSFAAHAQTVGSANVMGYTKIATPSAGSFDVVSLVNFSGNIDIQGVIQNLDSLNSAGVGQKENADKLYIWTGTGYDQFGLFQPTSGNPIWIGLNDGAWDLSFVLPTEATNTIPRGTAVWFATGDNAASTNFMTSGDVYDDGTIEIDLISNFTLVSYPYSSSVSLDSLVVSNATSAGTGGKANADKVYVWTGTGYDQFGLFQPTSGDPIWIGLNDGAWDLSFVPPTEATNAIDLGKGFWYEAPSGAKTIGFEQIYSLN